jgi:hypothetical protein
MKDDELKRMGDEMREHAKRRGIEFRLMKPRSASAKAPGSIIWSSRMLLDDHDDVVDAAPRHLRPVETPAAPFWGETWFWEQVTYVLVCLGPAMAASYLALAAKGHVGTRDIVLFVGTALSQFIAQKVRSVSSRQAALLKRLNFPLREVRCAPKVKRWAQAGQVLGAFLSVATAPSWWHLPSILWALFVYDLWRNHRESRKRQFVIGGF